MTIFFSSGMKGRHLDEKMHTNATEGKADLWTCLILVINQLATRQITSFINQLKILLFGKLQ